ncbi:MAG: 6-bladed beta-propeller [bacterium]
MIFLAVLGLVAGLPLIVVAGTADVERVSNPATPLSPPETIQVEELWRLDGESEDMVFGSISTAVADLDRTVYLLDSQLKEVIVIDKNGNLAARIGREGEGPGEFRAPVDLFVNPEGKVGIVQSMPGKFAMLSPDGDPVGDISMIDLGEGGIEVLRSAVWVSEYPVLASSLYDNSDPIFRTRWDFISVVDPTTGKVIRYRERCRKRDRANGRFLERERTLYSWPWEWTIGGDGTVYVNEAFDAYEIHVYDPCGDPVRIIEREYETRVREPELVKRMQAYYDEATSGRRAAGGAPLSYEVADSDQDIELLSARDDGTLWVLSSRGAYDTGEEELGTFDVFDADGRFDRQVTVLGEGDFMVDDFFLTRDLLIVARNTRVDLREDADATDPDEQEKESYEVICYRL